jgi:predicted nucleic acid-binding protein
MALVIDASVAACWVLPDEEHRTADSARHRLRVEAGYAPALWWFEIRNLLLIAERRGRIDETWSADALATLEEVPVDTDAVSDGAIALELARQHRLTFYDAAYLELAKRKSAALATLDGALIAAARVEGIELL